MIPKAAKLNIECQGSQSSNYKKAEDLSSDDEDVDSDDEDGGSRASQSVGNSSRPGKNSIASFQNQMALRQERKLNQKATDSLSSISIFSKGTNPNLNSKIGDAQHQKNKE